MFTFSVSLSLSLSTSHTFPFSIQSPIPTSWSPPPRPLPPPGAGEQPRGRRARPLRLRPVGPGGAGAALARGHVPGDAGGCGTWDSGTGWEVVWETESAQDGGKDADWDGVVFFQERDGGLKDSGQSLGCLGLPSVFGSINFWTRFRGLLYIIHYNTAPCSEGLPASRSCPQPTSWETSVCTRPRQSCLNPPERPTPVCPALLMMCYSYVHVIYNTEEERGKRNRKGKNRRKRNINKGM